MSELSQDYAAKPDYDHWCKMARWESKEAAALSVNIEPRNLSDEAIRSKDFPAALRTKYKDRLELVENHVQAGRIGSYCEPSDFLSWANANGVSFPEELKKAVESVKGQIADWKFLVEKLRRENGALKSQLDIVDGVKPSSAVSETLKNVERLSLLKMVRGMACGKYGYDPNKRNSAASGIRSDVEKQGFTIEADTVRKWLDQAFKLPPDEV